jgi:DNA adenine methylase
VAVRSEMKVTALVPYYGSDRMIADQVGQLLADSEWIGVPFAGGMSVLAHVDCRSIAVNDLNKHVVNLAICVACPERRRKILDRLKSLPFHPDVLFTAQTICSAWEKENTPNSVLVSGDSNWATHYFVSQWMGRSGMAGTDKEFEGNLSVRWTSSGGDSNTRYRSAVKSLAEFGRIMRRCNFTVLDFREFLKKCKDQKRHSIYCDAPFPQGGDKYKFNDGADDTARRKFHTDLRDAVSRFESATVVMRYYDHPLIRELYPESEWTWNHLEGRKQSNEKAAEVLLVNQRNSGGLF